MYPISTSELLAVWERGRARGPLQRALLLLAAASPDEPTAALADLSIGQRDARLLTLREWTFGPRLVSTAACPVCDERLELNFDVDDIRAESADVPPDGLPLTVGGYELRVRPPTTRDLAALPVASEPDEQRDVLLELCVLSARRDGAEQAAPLPPDVAAAVAAQLAQTDPQADVQLDLKCPACGHAWLALFDIVAYFWSEIEAWAYRMLRDVHVLAMGYGWREADILALSPLRRQIYLEMLGQ